MEALLTGLYNLYANNSTLTAAIPGGLFVGEAPQDTSSYPYGVMFVVSNTPGWTFTEDIEDYLIQFNIFDEVGEMDNSTILDVFDKLTTVYDWCKPTVSGYSRVFIKREFGTILRPDDAWQISVSYRCEIEKSRS